ncbi:MAG: hypothetical protein RR988_00625, partial [Clostridia bacterium]
MKIFIQYFKDYRESYKSLKPLQKLVPILGIALAAFLAKVNVILTLVVLGLSFVYITNNATNVAKLQESENKNAEQSNPFSIAKAVIFFAILACVSYKLWTVNKVILGVVVVFMAFYYNKKIKGTVHLSKKNISFDKTKAFFTEKKFAGMFKSSKENKKEKKAKTDKKAKNEMKDSKFQNFKVSIVEKAKILKQKLLKGGINMRTSIRKHLNFKNVVVSILLAASLSLGGIFAYTQLSKKPCDCKAKAQYQEMLNEAYQELDTAYDEIDKQNEKIEELDDKIAEME